MITVSFVDPQGATQTNAVMGIYRSHRTLNENESQEVSATDFTTESIQPTERTETVTYEVMYWINQAAKDNGASIYLLVNGDGERSSTTFSFSPTADYAGLSVKQMAEKHLTEVVLPPMQV